MGQLYCNYIAIILQLYCNYIAIIVLLVEMLVMFLERLRSSSPTTIAPRHATTAAPKNCFKMI